VYADRFWYRPALCHVFDSPLPTSTCVGSHWGWSCVLRPIAVPHLVLRGRVTDAAQSSAIVGADVIVMGVDGRVLKTIITGGDGSYSVIGLPRGKKVIAKYRKLGYSPDSRMYQIALSWAETIQDARLFSNTADSPYWSQWSNREKALIASHASSSDEQAGMYYEAWSNCFCGYRNGRAARTPAAAPRGRGEVLP
jgi:hypothetical protein